jgi:transposase-like protein
MELIQGEKTAGEVAKAYGVHPNSASAWRRQFLEKGPEIFAEDNTLQEYEKRRINHCNIKHQLKSILLMKTLYNYLE